MKEKKPFGTWKSPITAEKIAEGASRFGDLGVLEHRLYFSQSVPSEKGRYNLFKIDASLEKTPVLSTDQSAKTKVHEYGGGSFAVTKKGIYFINASDQNLYFKDEDEEKLITSDPLVRWADLNAHPNEKFLYAVQEEHEDSGEVLNTLVRITLKETVEVQVIASGADFYASPRVSPDGKKILWLQWNFPNMPWQQCSLWVGDINDEGLIINPQSVCDEKNVSVAQAEWDENNEILFAGDQSGFWNLYKNQQCLYAMDADFAAPLWVFGKKRFCPIPKKPNLIACIYTAKAQEHLAILNLSNQTLQVLDLPFTQMSDLRATEDHLWLFAASPEQPTALIQVYIEDGSYKVAVQSTQQTIEPEWIPQILDFSFTTSDNNTAYGLFFPPTNPNIHPETDLDPAEKPPLIINVHSGPTAHVAKIVKPNTLFWTSRGFAYLEVNYRGSSGYGREFRESMNGHWGEMDIQDCMDAALELVHRGLVDPNKLLIRGSSSGGFSSLLAATKFPQLKAVTSLYGISDLVLLQEKTHKFEKHYNDSLIGPFDPALYRSRSPLFHAEKISTPTLFLQGLEDKVVDPLQAEKLYSTLLERKIPTCCHLFEGEGHGFRKKETIIRALEIEYSFYLQILNLPHSANLQKASIDNL